LTLDVLLREARETPGMRLWDTEIERLIRAAYEVGKRDGLKCVPRLVEAPCYWPWTCACANCSNPEVTG
jgi:hypothetical protein